jgi:small subunit ribosomal protein S1
MSEQHIPPPNIRDKLPPDLEQEFSDALGDAPVEELLAAGDPLSSQPLLEEESRHTGRVVAVRRDDVFLELGSREQGSVSIRQFEEPPQVGTTLEVIVQRFNPEEGLYELTIPDAAVDVDDWADVHEGMLLEARVTGHNSGGLECEVNRLRGFIPISQIALYRVEDLPQFVDQKLTCLVTEANPQRRNLVLSRRAVLEREREEARQQLLASLQPGQVHEGVVRKLVDFGAFVDIGGLDGLLHISQMSWDRIEHPREVLSEGQTIKVKIEKVDQTTGKIGLGYRDMLENPWHAAAEKYPPNTVVEGTVTKLAEYGAFVALEPGVEGLVHISELSAKRVWRVSDVVQEGQKVQVLVLSVDSEAQRISLSISQAFPEPEPEKEPDQSQPDAAQEAPRKSKPKRRKPDQPLYGGLGKSGRGTGFGQIW